MDYSFLVDGMTWSYSRISAFEDCPYGFLLRYIKSTEVKPNFFTQYGSFIHDILRQYYSGELDISKLPEYYMLNFWLCVTKKAPSRKVFANYFSQGLNYLSDSVKTPDGSIVGVEKSVSFCIGDKAFVGFIDLVTDCDGELVITDHKSRDLKPRTKGGKYTKSDAELDKYLRQLYLYAIPIEKEFGRLPAALRFNCFRTGTEISQPFDKAKYKETQLWALDTIDKIRQEKQWKPNLDWFKCKYLCGVSDQCEYFKMFGGG